MKILKLTTIALCVAAVAACGGGSGDTTGTSGTTSPNPPTKPTTPPAKPNPPTKPTNPHLFVETEAEKEQREKIATLYGEVKAFYDGSPANVVSGANNQFSRLPEIKTDPSTGRTYYTTGIYKQEFKQYMLKWWAFYKAIAQRPDPYISNLDDEKAEYAALTLSALREITHTPTRPKDMNDDIFGPAYSGAFGGNLFTAPSNYWFHETVQFNFTEGKVQDDLKGGVKIPSDSYMGHRWNGLNINTKSVGFGYNHLNRYLSAVYYVFGKKGNDGFSEFSAFPHGYYPIQAELARNNTRLDTKLFNKRFPHGFKADTIIGRGGFYNIWTVQQPKNFSFIDGKNITVTIRDTTENGTILDRITAPVGLSKGVVNGNGSFMRVKRSNYANGWTITMKPKDGIISGAAKTVLNTDKKKVFHITIEGDGLKPRTALDNIKYRIIYYDLDH